MNNDTIPSGFLEFQIRITTGWAAGFGDGPIYVSVHDISAYADHALYLKNGNKIDVTEDIDEIAEKIMSFKVINNATGGMT